jgi:hypothetical protein
MSQRLSLDDEQLLGRRGILSSLTQFLTSVALLNPEETRKTSRRTQQSQKADANSINRLLL